MRFWDASAIIPLLVAEPSSPTVHDLLGADDALVVWWASRVECVSALRRREREGRVDSEAVGVALRLLDTLTGGWSEVLPSDRLRGSAERALAVHSLRAADALQLAAALVWNPSPTSTAELVCLDARLREAASREGFRVLPEEREG